MNNNLISEIKLSYNRVNLNPKGILNSSIKINEFLKTYLDKIGEDITLQEKFFALFFDVSMSCIGVLKVTEGGIDAVLVDARLIYSTAVTTGAKTVVIAHNHPSGNMKASVADIELTNKIKKGLNTLDVKLIDHIIINPIGTQYFSFCDEGLI